MLSIITSRVPDARFGSSTRNFALVAMLALSPGLATASPALLTLD